MNIDINTIQAIRQQQDAIDALPDREYIKTICEVMMEMIDNPMTRDLDFTEARKLCKDFAEAIEVQLEEQASNIREPELDNKDEELEDKENNELDDEEIDFEDDFNESVRAGRRPTISESLRYLRHKGYRIDG